MYNTANVDGTYRLDLPELVGLELGGARDRHVNSVPQCGNRQELRGGLVVPLALQKGDRGPDVKPLRLAEGFCKKN